MGLVQKDGLLAPTSFTARTLNSYVSPSLRPSYVYLLSISFSLVSLTNLSLPMVRASKMYMMTSEPPSNLGAFQVRLM